MNPIVSLVFAIICAVVFGISIYRLVRRKKTEANPLSTQNLMRYKSQHLAVLHLGCDYAHR